MHYTIDRSAKTSIYRQIYHQLSHGILSGALAPLSTLPTERYWAVEFGVSKGTVRKAYAALKRDGLVTISQGSGTYVAQLDLQKRAERMREDLTAAFDRLAALKSYSISDIYRISTARLGLPQAMNQRLQIAWVDCSREMLFSTAEQIRTVCDVDVDSFTLAEVVADPAAIGGRYDAVVVTENHYKPLKKALAGAGHIIVIRPTISNITGMAIAKIPPGTEVVVLYESETYCGYIRRLMAQFEKDNPLRFFYYPNAEPGGFYAEVGKSAVIVPHDMALSLGQDLLSLINKYEWEGGILIPLQYTIDQGSLLMLMEQFHEIVRQEGKRRRNDG